MLCLIKVLRGCLVCKYVCNFVLEVIIFLKKCGFLGWVWLVCDGCNVCCVSEFCLYFIVIWVYCKNVMVYVVLGWMVCLISFKNWI